MSRDLALHLGVKSDPIEYRYSFEWLFALMAEEGVHRLQGGTFFELYQLPDRYFHRLREQAEAKGVRIESMFTSHRELGGLLSPDPDWQAVGVRNYKRYIEIGRILGARSVGSNPGAVLRDRIHDKDEAVAAFVHHMKETLMPYAHDCGLERLTIEPMSCLAEPPTLPEEMVAMAEDLMAHHASTPNTVPIGFCLDIAHGYANAAGEVVHTPQQLLEAALPWTTELHLKNTDARFDSTFGFDESDRVRGIVNIPSVVQSLEDHADALPVTELTGFLEIGGPKLGRDYSDHQLESQLRESLRYLSTSFSLGKEKEAKRNR